MSLAAPPNFLVTTVTRDSQTETQLTGFQWTCGGGGGVGGGGGGGGVDEALGDPSSSD